MGHSPLGHAGAHVAKFPIGTAVSYTPGVGTYGYEDAGRDEKGGIPATVIGHSALRVRIEIRMPRHTKRIAVDAESLS